MPNNKRKIETKVTATENNRAIVIYGSIIYIKPQNIDKANLLEYYITASNVRKDLGLLFQKAVENKQDIIMLIRANVVSQESIAKIIGVLNTIYPNNNFIIASNRLRNKSKSFYLLELLKLYVPSECVFLHTPTQKFDVEYEKYNPITVNSKDSVKEIISKVYFNESQKELSEDPDYVEKSKIKVTKADDLSELSSNDGKQEVPQSPLSPIEKTLAELYYQAFESEMNKDVVEGEDTETKFIDNCLNLSDAQKDSYYFRSMVMDMRNAKLYTKSYANIYGK